MKYRVFFCVFFCVCLFCAPALGESAPLRLRVVASSDSEYDQQAKMALSARLFLTASEAMRDCSSPSHALRRAKAALPGAELCLYAYPDGVYPTLQYTLGAGAGHNFWCMLYPRLFEQVADPAGETALEWMLARLLRLWRLWG